MKGRFTALLLISASLFSRASMAVSTPEKEKNEPLVMENADRFEGYRSRGEYVLSGKVRFSHGTLRLETERAVWLKDKNLVYCEAGMKVVQHGATLTADRGSYDKNQGQATAEGNVFMHDSSGDVEASGRNVLYQRYKHLTTLNGDPIIRRFYAAKDSTAKTSDKKPDKASPQAPVAKRDTLRIRGDVMVYNDSTQVAVADGQVRIDRNELLITCKKAEYHNVADSLFLLGDPMVVSDDNRIKGQIMRMGMHGEDIRSLLVKGAAQAHSIESATDTSSARQSDVQGDSLFLAFKEKAIDSVQVFKNATGTYYDIDKPDYVNKMSGDYMVLRFVSKQINSANVLGGAKSTYYHFEKKTLKGRNDAEGDTIDFAFKEGRVEEVMVKGQAKGTYFGAKQGKVSHDSAGAAAKPTVIPAAPVLGNAEAKATADSLARPAPKTPAAAPGVNAAKPATGSSGQPSQPEHGRPMNPWRKK